MRPIQRSIRINGDIQPKQVKISIFGDYAETGISAFSSNYRQFARKIKKGDKVEEVSYWEPIGWRGINNLPLDTKNVKMSLVVENPLFKTYRLVKITDIEGHRRKEEILKFASGKKESFADIQELYNLESPAIVGKSVRVAVRLELLKSPGLAGTKSLTVSELSYKINRAEGPIKDKGARQNAEKGGGCPEN